MYPGLFCRKIIGVPRKKATDNAVSKMKGDSKISPNIVEIRSNMRLPTGIPGGKSMRRFYQTLWYILQQERQ